MARVRPTRAPVLVVVLVAALTSLAVVGGGSVAGGVSARRKVPPSQWVAGICSTLRDWNTSLQSAVSEERAALPAARKLHGNARVRKAKEILQKLVNESVTVTKKASKALRKVGQPDAANGVALADTVDNSFSRVLRGFEKAKHDADALPTNSESAFTKLAGRLGTQLTQLGQRARTDFASLRAHDTSGVIAAAIAADTSCDSFAAKAASS